MRKYPTGLYKNGTAPENYLYKSEHQSVMTSIYNTRQFWLMQSSFLPEKIEKVTLASEPLSSTKLYDVYVSNIYQI